MIFPSASFGGKTFWLLWFVLGLGQFTKFFMYAVFHTVNIHVSLMQAIELYLHNYDPYIRFILSVVGRLRGLAVVCLTTDHYHPCSNLGVGIAEGCFIFDFTSLPLEVARPI